MRCRLNDIFVVSISFLYFLINVHSGFLVLISILLYIDLTTFYIV